MFPRLRPAIYNILRIIYYVNKNNAKIKLFSSGPGRTRADQGSPRAIQADQGNFNSQLKMILCLSGSDTGGYTVETEQFYKKGLKKGI